MLPTSSTTGLWFCDVAYTKKHLCITQTIATYCITLRRSTYYNYINKVLHVLYADIELHWIPHARILLFHIHKQNDVQP